MINEFFKRNELYRVAVVSDNGIKFYMSNTVEKLILSKYYWMAYECKKDKIIFWVKFWKKFNGNNFNIFAERVKSFNR